MDLIEDYFECSGCRNRNFRQTFSFSVQFHTVNFSDALIYDRLDHKIYECTRCGMTFTRDHIDKKLAEFKKTRRSES